MTKRPKALAISKAVREAVMARDGGACIICGRRGDPCAHFVSRAQGGLGIEEYIVTLCDGCHRLYDQSTHRGYLREAIAEYMREKYENWDDVLLTYRKEL